MGPAHHPCQLPEDRSRWSEVALGMCSEIRELLLRTQPLALDGSADIETLAARNVARAALPCPVVAYDRGDDAMVCFHLGGGPFAFSPSDTDGLDRLQPDLSPEALGVSTRREDPPFACIRAAISAETDAPLDRMALQQFGWALEGRVQEESRRLARLRDDAFAAIGLRASSLRPAAGPPAPQYEILRRGDPASGRRLTASDLVEDMTARTRTVLAVPDGVESLIQRARLLYVHSWEEWEFLTVAEHYAVLALEASLRMLYGSWLAEKAIVSGVDRRGMAANRESRPDFEAVRRSAGSLRRISVNGRPLPRTKDQLIDHAVAIGVLTTWEAERRVRPLLALRDLYSHPTTATMDWLGNIRRTVADCVLCTNLMWARLVGPMPDEFAREP